MIGPRYWATGVAVHYDSFASAPAWAGRVEFYDDGFVNDNAEKGRVATEGVLRTRYHVEAETSEVALAAVVDALIRDAARLGITFDLAGGGRRIYYEGDGVAPSLPPPPPDWRHQIKREADRIGWVCPYEVEVHDGGH